jgi:arsenate reductase-like glutaredoxin family protein
MTRESIEQLRKELGRVRDALSDAFDLNDEESYAKLMVESAILHRTLLEAEGELRMGTLAWCHPVSQPS